MIKAFKIENFQSHKNTKIKFDPGVNVILGSSDSGKSALFRAMLWVFYNRPLGNAFQSWWGGDTVVTGKIGSATIARKRTKTENSYTLNDKITFKAVKTDVPDEIQDIIKIDRKINVQAQADPFFLLSPSDSPGKVAEQFNSIANLDLIDESRKKINTLELSETRGIAQLKTNIETKEKELEGFSWVEDAEKAMDRITVLENKKNEAEGSISTITKFIINIKEAQGVIKHQQQYLELKPAIKSSEEIEKEINRLTKAKSIIQNLVVKIKAKKIILGDDGEVTRAKTSIYNTNELIETYKTLKIEKVSLNDLINKLKIASKKLVEEKERALSMQEELNANMPSICPLCGK